MKQAVLMLPAMLVIALSPAAFAEGQRHTAVSNDTANQYFARCMAVDDERMSDDAQESLCGCTAAGLLLKLSSEDLDKMTTTPGEGRAAYDKMLIHVYGPCMEEPVREILYNDCMGDKQIEMFALRNQAALCGCLAGRATDGFEDYAPGLMEQSLRGNPVMTDPYYALAYSQNIRSRAYDSLTPCLHMGN